MNELETEVQDLIQKHGFMPVLHALRTLCEREATEKAALESPQAQFFAEFWRYASQNMAAAELLLLDHVAEKAQAKATSDPEVNV